MTGRDVIVAGLLAAAVTLTAGCSPQPQHVPSAPETTAGQGPGSQEADANGAGDIPDSQAFVVFTAPDSSFTVQVPEGWARTDSPGGVTFTDNFNSVIVESRTGTSAPTPESARLTELPVIAAATPGVKSGEVTTVDRPAGQAILLTYQQDSPASPVTGRSTTQAVERYEFFRGGHTVILTLAGPVGADNVDPWRKITESFRWST
ncbi:MAG: hypothetical protein QOF67_281 [Mycobacterium sp.]|nr:hypothetical protein [Mycobacterium sp.]